MEYHFFGETLHFDLHSKEELFSDLIKANGCSTDMETVFAYQQYIHPNKIAVDIGANIGWNCLFLSKFSKNGSVLAFEPDKTNFSLLQHNLAINHTNNVKLFNIALSDEKKTGRLYHSRNNFGNHLLDPVMISDEHIGFEDIEVDTFDNVLLENNISGTDISFIKIDIQGHEPNFFSGAKQFFKHNRPPIILEYAPFHIKQTGGSPFELFGQLDKYNYTPYIIEQIDLRNPKFSIRQVNYFDLIKDTPRLYNYMMHQDLLLLHEE